MNAHPIDQDAPQECGYCGVSVYRVDVDPRPVFKASLVNPMTDEEHRHRRMTADVMREGTAR